MKKINRLLFVLVISSLLVFIGCEDRNDLTAPAAPSTGNADFSTLVSIGNSLTAGYQQGALYKSSQDYSFGNLIAQQVQTNYAQPLISDPGMHHVGPTDGRMEVTSLDPFAFTVNTASGAPLNADYPKAYNNMGIPGIILADVLFSKTSPSAFSGDNIFIDVVLRNQNAATPTTPLEQALSLQPTFVLGWIGNNDILGYATTGGTLPHTDVPTFTVLYAQFAGALAQSGAKAALANIPDVSTIPFFTTVGPQLAVGSPWAAISAGQAGLRQLGLPFDASGDIIYESENGTNFGIFASKIAFADSATIRNLSVLFTLSTGSITSFLGDTTGAYYTATGTAVPFGYDVSTGFGFSPVNPLPGKFVLDQGEIAEVQTTTAGFNSAIAAQAAQYGFALVDINSFFTSTVNGYVADGVNFSNTYVTGGVFSLDGVHPTTQGYGIIANQFIKAINKIYSAKIPEVNVSTLPGSLVFSSGTAPKYGKYGVPEFPLHAFDNFRF